VNDFFQSETISHVILAAAKVGGIHANPEYPANFIYENLMISSHIIHAAYEANVDMVINLGSSCIYPKAAAQPRRGLSESLFVHGQYEKRNLGQKFTSHAKPH